MVVENNNELTQFLQIKPEYVQIDKIPDEPPSLNDLDVETIHLDNGELYKVYTFYDKDVSSGANIPVLKYLDHFPLTKELRQSSVFKFPKESELRGLVLPGETLNRKYTPTFYSENQQILYTQLDPTIDFSNCRISTRLELKDLYISGWVYVGRKLDGMTSIPFNENLWLIRDPDTGALARFDVTEDHKTYILPYTNMKGKVKEDGTLVTHETINEVLNTIGKLDCGEWW